MIEVGSEHRCFGGTQGFYRSASSTCDSEMRFSVYQPPQAKSRQVPVLYYLAGLTCTEETFMIKAGRKTFRGRTWNHASSKTTCGITRRNCAGDETLGICAAPTHE